MARRKGNRKSLARATAPADADGRLWRATDPAGGVTEYTYEDTTNHRMKTIKDPRGIVYLTNEYDAAIGQCIPLSGE